jgi:hypothetical protein
MTIARNEPKHEVTLTQLKDFLESIEAGRTEEVVEWLRAAIRLCEGDWPEVIEGKENL